MPALATKRHASPSEVEFEVRGGNSALFSRRDREVLISGPAGTGKTIAALWKLHLAALKYPGMRAMMVRKTGTALAASALVSFQERVLGSGNFGVSFFGGSKLKPAQFEYPNGSVIVVGGMDNPDKIMSAEYDLAYVNEATELTEADWESITSRLRYGVMPYQQLFADCNPSFPSHWLKQRCDAGKTLELPSRHEDNPRYHNGTDYTVDGLAYLETLDALTGVRNLRLRKGIWAAAEGLVYEGWDAAVHVIPRFDIPALWPRFWVIDFGFVNPFVWQWWASDPDGRLFLYREIYMTQRLVTDHAAQGMALSKNEPKPTDVITDHDAEDRATFEKATGVKTTAAVKNVSRGIQAVAERLKEQPDKRRRLYILRDSRVELDTRLKEAGKPTSTAEEHDSYIWDTRQGRSKGEQPLKENDHGMDAERYMVAYVDIGEHPPTTAPRSLPRQSHFQRQTAVPRRFRRG